MSSPYPPEPFPLHFDSTTAISPRPPPPLPPSSKPSIARSPTARFEDHYDAAAAAGPVAELPSLSLSPFPSSPSLSSLVAHNPFDTSCTVARTRRLSRPPSRTLPSLIPRFSAVGGGASSTDTLASRPFWPRSAEGAHKLHRRAPDADQRPRERSNNWGSRSLRAQPQTLNSIAPSDGSSTPPSITAPPSSQQSADPSSDLEAPASTSSTSSNSAHSRSSKSADDNCKMHQTSSRLLRMTDDDRPFTRDFNDLFSTLMVSLPLTPHRVRFQRIDHTFTSEEAITNLGSLKFSQSNRMPDPKDSSRIVTTTTTTTFSMAKEMARSVCNKFLEARFIEAADAKNDFNAKNAVWQLTPKGMYILQRFCQRNGITARHVTDLLESPRNTMHLVLLEREPDTDKIHRDQATIEVVFRRFVGQDKPNVKYNTTSSDSDSLNDYQTGLVGVKMARERKIGDRTFWNTFTGKATVDWLMDCCTMVDRRETVELAGLFIEYGLMKPCEALPTGVRFMPSKTVYYQITEKGQRIAGWLASPKSSVNGDALDRRRDGNPRDSNANRMTIIINDPALRLLFREFLRDTHCEENLSFYFDVKEFLSTYQAAKKSSSPPRIEVIRETLAAAYTLYNAFLAPGSPCELNIDHNLRQSLASRMTRAIGDDEAMVKSLDEVAHLFDSAQNSVFKLMASDSVPKFMREPKYAAMLRERNLEGALGGPMTSSRTTQATIQSSK